MTKSEIIFNNANTTNNTTTENFGSERDLAVIYEKKAIRIIKFREILKNFPHMLAYVGFFL